MSKPDLTKRNSLILAFKTAYRRYWDHIGTRAPGKKQHDWCDTCTELDDAVKDQIGRLEEALRVEVFMESDHWF